MKITLYRQIDPADPLEIATFKSEGDALWAATVYQAHKILGKNHRHWVEVREGKHIRVLYPAAVINPQIFNLTES